MLHTSIQSNKHITGTPKALSRLLCAPIMFSQLILTWKNLLRPSNFQTIVISGGLYEKGKWIFLIACTKVFWIISYAEVRLTLSSMTSMATKTKKRNQTMMCLCYRLTKRNNKATRVKTRMIKKKNRKNEPLEKIKIKLIIFRKKLVKWAISGENFSFQIRKWW